MTTLTKATQPRSRGQIARWSFGSGLVLGLLHNPIWHLVTAIVPFI